MSQPFNLNANHPSIIKVNIFLFPGTCEHGYYRIFVLLPILCSLFVNWCLKFSVCFVLFSCVNSLLCYPVVYTMQTLMSKVLLLDRRYIHLSHYYVFKMQVLLCYSIGSPQFHKFIDSAIILGILHCHLIDLFCW